MSSTTKGTRRWAFAANERTILCCSSTRHRRFIDDLVTVMSLPSGSRVRLRYGDTVCDPLIRSLGEEASPSLDGVRVLVTHVGFTNRGTALLPLRTGSVVEVRTVGSVTYLEVELGDFVEGQVGTTFADRLDPLATRPLPVQPPDSDRPEGCFCQFLSSPPALQCGQDTGLWERVAKTFLAAINNSNADFPFIFNLNVVQKRSRKPVPLRGGTLIIPAISQIELHIRTLSTKSSFDSIIQAPVGTLAFNVDHPDARMASGAQHPIDTTRNLLVSQLTTNISLRPAYGSLTVTARRRDVDVTCQARPESQARTEGDSIAPQQPEPVDEVVVELPVAVGRPWTRILAIGFISAVVAMHAFDISQLASYANYVWWKTGLVFAAAFVALFMGLKPQAGN